MPTGIIAIGTANPACRGAQETVLEFMAEALQLKPKEKQRLQSLYEATGIKHRHTVLDDFAKTQGELTFFPNDRDQSFPSTAARMELYKQHALPLALNAIQNCLSSLKDYNLKEITHLITISCTGMYAPGMDIEIIEHLNLLSSTQRTAVNFMGCYGVFNGIKVANAICKAEPSAKVLLVSVELCTIHFQKSKISDDIIASAIFADGAGAALLEANPQRPHLSLENFHCDLVPQSKDEMAWHIADQGFAMRLSAYVPQCVESGIAEFVAKLLAQQKMQLADIDYFAIHPGGAKILQACETALNISPEANRFSYQVLRDNGNMSSATILFVLKAIWEALTTRDAQKNIFACAFGPGLTLESILLKINS